MSQVQKSFSKNTEALSSFLLNHVVPGSIMSSDLADGMRVNTVGGAALDVIEVRGGMLVGGARLLAEEGRVNYEAANGFIHMIEDVVFPYESTGEDEDKPKKKRSFQFLI